MTRKERLHHLVDELPESAMPEAKSASGGLDGLRNGDVELPREIREAPRDDEPETEVERA